MINNINTSIKFEFNGETPSMCDIRESNSKVGLMNIKTKMI